MIKGTLFFPYQRFLMRFPNEKLFIKDVCHYTLLRPKKATWPICYPSKRTACTNDKPDEVTYPSGKIPRLRWLHNYVVQMRNLNKALSLGTLNEFEVTSHW